MNDQSLEQKARRVAKRAGFIAKKSRWRAHSVDNLGGFQVIDPYLNSVQEGVRFEMSAEEVIKYCQNHKGTLTGEVK
jgi:hypothetical protein